MSLITKIEFIAKSDNAKLLKQYQIDMHDLLTDDADWDAEYWDFYPEQLLQYTKMLNEIIKASSKGITFQALWAGENATEVIELTDKELLNLVNSNKIKTSAKYIANKSA